MRSGLWDLRVKVYSEEWPEDECSGRCGWAGGIYPVVVGKLMPNTGFY